LGPQSRAADSESLRASFADPESEPERLVDRWIPAAVLAFVVLGLVLRFRGLLDYWLNPDEGIYYSTLTRASFDDFWTEVAANAHPPAYYLLLRGVGWLTWDFVLIRSVTSLLFGVAAIWLFWRVGRQLGGRGISGVVAGLVAAGLLATNGEAVALSQVIRPYMLLVALLSLSLHCLLKYRSDPTDRTLAAYVVLASSAVLTHYSAALALGVFAVLIAYFKLEGLEKAAWVRLAVGQLIPFAVVGLVYALHMRTALDSDLMGDALGTGGWLDDWLIVSPREAWSSLVAFQIFHLPSGYQGRTAVLLLGAIVLSALSRDRVVAVMATAALSVAILVSAFGLYPFGPSRHNAWLIAFTVPTLAWLASRIATSGVRNALSVSLTVTAMFAFGNWLERPLGGQRLRTIASEEKVISRQELTPLVVRQLDRDAGPQLILMSDQTYNFLMPLYAREREDVTVSSDSTLFTFPYGTRRVVVTRTWDWNGVEHVGAVVESLDETLPSVLLNREPSVLLVAGGWGSSVFPGVAELQERGAISSGNAAFGLDPSGEEILRLVAVVIERQQLTGH
jgi:hypothetical protein